MTKSNIKTEDVTMKVDYKSQEIILYLTEKTTFKQILAFWQMVEAEQKKIIANKK